MFLGVVRVTTNLFVVIVRLTYLMDRCRVDDGSFQFYH
jgi:hypothetical protein